MVKYKSSTSIHYNGNGTQYSGVYNCLKTHKSKASLQHLYYNKQNILQGYTTCII